MIAGASRQGPLESYPGANVHAQAVQDDTCEGPPRPACNVKKYQMLCLIHSRILPFGAAPTFVDAT